MILICSLNRSIILCLTGLDHLLTGFIMSLHLSSQNTTRFIELYCQERLLYDTTHINYRNRRLRSAATQRIAQQLGVPGFGPLEVTFKFKNLRNSYSQELKKMDESDYEYYPSVHWFELMNSFLRPFVYTRPVPALPVSSSLICHLSDLFYHLMHSLSVECDVFK